MQWITDFDDYLRGQLVIRYYVVKILHPTPRKSTSEIYFISYTFSNNL